MGSRVCLRIDENLVKSAQFGRIDEAAERDPCPCAKIVQMKMEKDAVNVPLRVSVAINRLDGSSDLGEDAQFLCHV